VADIGWCWNNVKPLISSCIQNLFFKFCFVGGGLQPPPPLGAPVSPHPTEPEGSLARLKKSATCPYPALNQSSPHRPNRFLFPLRFFTRIVYALRLFVLHAPLLPLFLIWQSGYTVGLSVFLWALSLCAVCNVLSISQVSSKKLHSGSDCAGLIQLRRCARFREVSLSIHAGHSN
jgi:hypothetical protein